MPMIRVLKGTIVQVLTHMLKRPQPINGRCAAVYLGKHTTHIISVWSFRHYAIELNDFFIRAAIFVFLILVLLLFISTLIIRLLVTLGCPNSTLFRE